jgi:proteasome lid subunit RPN8/RPN11
LPINDVTDLASDIGELEKITNEETREIKGEITKLSSEIGGKEASELQAYFGKLVRVNNKLIEILENIDDESFIEAHREAKQLERRREELAENAFKALKQADVQHGVQLEELEEKLEEFEEVVESELQEMALKQARQKVSESASMLVKEKALQRFIAQVERDQVEDGEETAGVFHYIEVDGDIFLDKYVPLENRLDEEKNDLLTRSEAFFPGEDEERMLKASEENLVFAHSHPGKSERLSQTELKSHSGMDSSYQAFNLDINKGLLAAPDPKENWIWLVPQVYQDGEWRNLELGVVRDGEILSSDQLKQKYPQIPAYNNAIAYTIAYRDPRQSEDQWLRFYRDHVA